MGGGAFPFGGCVDRWGLVWLGLSRMSGWVSGVDGWVGIMDGVRCVYGPEWDVYIDGGG